MRETFGHGQKYLDDSQDDPKFPILLFVFR